jgi:hypothetical protein
MAQRATAPLPRVTERRRAAALARHHRDCEQLPITEIARRLGRAPATVKAYLHDPTGEKTRAVKARYRGYCRNCGADTSPRNGKGDAYLYCRRCRPGAAAPRWTRERIRAAILACADLYGAPPSSYDWSRTHARRRGGDALERLAPVIGRPRPQCAHATAAGRSRWPTPGPSQRRRPHTDRSGAERAGAVRGTFGAPSGHAYTR